jgi:aspartyl-tRNA(Asn)/glutamyl-tRNA(Gln) amidotransferase subunit B
MTATHSHTDLRTRLVVGMEVHVELATRTKMWTSAPNVAHPDHYDAGPNTLLDPVVIGMPGTLPVMNRRAVEMSILVGLALNCQIARRTKWDRKSYYYPDLPKNYQISQYDQPLCYEGVLTIEIPHVHGGDGREAAKAIRIIRAHLEEDAGKLLHEAPGGGSIEHSIVDLNRAGTPLLEIVTYPDISSPDEAVAFAQTLRDICRHLGVTEGVMQRGHMRFEPNINVVIERDGQTYKTPIVEIKNLNSFRSVHGAIAYEYERQVEEWLQSGVVMTPGTKSTRGWDDARGQTFLQREKEEAHDYRYFPDPDLVEVHVDDAWLDAVRAQLSEFPQAKRRRYAQDLGLDARQIDQILSEPATTRFFEAVLAAGVEGKRAAAVVLNQAAKRANEQGVAIDRIGITPQQAAAVILLQDADKIGSTAAADLFNHLCDANDASLAAEAIAGERGLLQVSDSAALEAYVDQVLADPRNEKAVADLRAGKDKAIGALMGQIMKLSKGKANPKVVTDVIKSRLQP